MQLAMIDVSIIVPALIAGLLVLATHVPLGMVVLKRGIIFIDLAIAQIAGACVIFASILIDEPDNYSIQLIATGCAILGAVFLRWTERNWPDIQEAIIGVAFVVSACIGILLLANNPQGSEHLKDLLAGQILWVSYGQIISTLILYTAILIIWFGYKKSQTGIGFYLLFAITITSSVQLAGVYLVFSSLILPALAVHRLKAASRKLLLAYLCGILGYVAGLIISSLADLPSSPAIVLSLTASAVLFWWLISLITGGK
ncbi:MAG: metal ABC transporter permease [Gammaproteobacteria bacterium]|nr:metal ABC transporter permease [Gammaproteobacteria bacterium]